MVWSGTKIVTEDTMVGPRCPLQRRFVDEDLGATGGDWMGKEIVAFSEGSLVGRDSGVRAERFQCIEDNVELRKELVPNGEGACRVACSNDG